MVLRACVLRVRVVVVVGEQYHQPILNNCLMHCNRGEEVTRPVVCTTSVHNNYTTHTHIVNHNGLICFSHFVGCGVKSLYFTARTIV